MLLTRLENLLIRLWTQSLDTALLNWDTGNKSVTTNNNKPPPFHYMKKKQRRIMWIRIFILLMHFIVLNLIGCFVARYFVNRTDIPEQQWDWATTWYWASQTITTVGVRTILTCYIWVFTVCNNIFAVFRLWDLNAVRLFDSTFFLINSVR